MAGQPRGPIAIVAHTHPSVSKGGAEIAAYSLYEGLRRTGTEAIFIAVCSAAERAKLILASDHEFAVVSDPRRYDHFYHLASADIWRQLKTILLDQDVRLVNFHHFLQIGVNTLKALAAETAIPFTVTLHEFLAICAHHGQMVTRPARRLCQADSPVACAGCFPENTRQQFTARKQLIQSALLAASGFIAPSHFLAERMVAWGLPREKLLVIENGLRHVDPTRDRSRAALDGQSWTFGYFGQITPFKGVDTLLETIELLGRQPDIGARIRIRVHGTMIGQEASFIARFNDVFARHGFATYAGGYDNADVHKLMHGCDYVLTPSTWWENSPVVIQEAFESGRPVICTGIGGMAEKVPNRRAGLHFRPGDAADLARAILEAADSTLHAALCSALPQVSDQVTMAHDYLASFNRLMAPETLPEASPAPRRRARVAV
jgi:glycosyltransferase involved in cell wall biosynthesis